MKLVKPKLIKRQSKTAGLPPGTLVHVGERKTEEVRITFMDYDERDFQEKQVSNIEDCFPFKDTTTVTWINIDGLHRLAMIKEVGEVEEKVVAQALFTEVRTHVRTLSSVDGVKQMISFPISMVRNFSERMILNGNK